MTDTAQFIQHGQQVIDIEQTAVAALKTKIDDNFTRACQLMFQWPRPYRCNRYGQIRTYW